MARHGKGVEGVPFPEPHYEMKEEEPEELCCGPLDHVLVVGVVCSAGQTVEEEEPGYGRWHWHGLSCSASFASAATLGQGLHLQTAAGDKEEGVGVHLKKRRRMKRSEMKRVDVSGGHREQKMEVVEAPCLQVVVVEGVSHGYVPQNSVGLRVRGCHCD